MEEDFPGATVIWADVDEDFLFLEGGQVIFDGIFGFSEELGKPPASDFWVRDDGINNSLRSFSNLFLGEFSEGLWVNFPGKIFRFWVNWTNVFSSWMRPFSHAHSAAASRSRIRALTESEKKIPSYYLDESVRNLRSSKYPFL